MFRIPAYLHRHPDSGIFYFRLTVPQHLRHIVGKREVKRSLRTGLRTVATPLAQQLYLDTRRIFFEAEQRMVKRRANPKNDDYTGLIIVRDTDAKGVKREITIEYDDPQKEVEAAAQLLDLTKNHPPFVTPAPTVKKEPTYSLTRMILDFLTEKKRTAAWTAKTTEENQAIFQLLKEILKNPAVETISIKTASQFKGTLLQLPPNRTKGKYRGKSVKELLAMRPSKTVSVSTVNKYLRRVSSLFDWGRKHGYTHENPFAGLGIREKRQAHEERAKFSEADISCLFNSKNLNQSTGYHSYCYWLPWLGLYTGARIEELCQLHLTDICKEGDIWVIDVNDDKEKRLKTLASKRLIPVHPKLIEIGFIEHVEKLQLKKQKRLFPELKKQRDGFSQAASKWFGRYREMCEVGPPFHSFRHTFADELKQMGVDRSKTEALIGHKDTSMAGGRYGKPYRVDVLYPVICLLNFDI